jgi:DnaJ family protein C protein 13
MRSKAGNSSLQVLDEVCETPEMIWTAEMQGELRVALDLLLKPTLKASGEQDFNQLITVRPEYSVKFRQLESELYIGGVYIRLFLKQPTFRLTNPIFFLEKLVEFWEGSFDVQVSTKQSNTVSGSGDDYSKALVLGKEDFLSLITSCIVCVMKGEDSIVDHLLAWGFAHKILDLLKRAIKSERRGAPVVCIVRLIQQLISKVAAVDNLISAPIDIIVLLMQALDNNSNAVNASTTAHKVQISKEAAIIAEVMKRLFQTTTSSCIADLVSMGMRAGLPIFLLDNIIGASPEALADVRNASALKVYAVDTLKAMLLIDSAHIGVLQAILEAHHSWGEYRYQSHDLFITVF